MSIVTGIIPWTTNFYLSAYMYLKTKWFDETINVYVIMGDNSA